jgi:hypothetical protein
MATNALDTSNGIASISISVSLYFNASTTSPKKVINAPATVPATGPKKVCNAPATGPKKAPNPPLERIPIR